MQHATTANNAGSEDSQLDYLDGPFLVPFVIGMFAGLAVFAACAACFS